MTQTGRPPRQRLSLVKMGETNQSKTCCAALGQRDPATGQLPSWVTALSFGVFEVAASRCPWSANEASLASTEACEVYLCSPDALPFLHELQPVSDHTACLMCCKQEDSSDASDSCRESLSGKKRIIIYLRISVTCP